MTLRCVHYLSSCPYTGHEVVSRWLKESHFPYQLLQLLQDVDRTSLQERCQIQLGALSSQGSSLKERKSYGLAGDGLFITVPLLSLSVLLWKLVGRSCSSLCWNESLGPVLTSGFPNA